MNNYYRSDGWVKDVRGPAIPGAQVYVCTQPANVFPPITPPRTTPVPWPGPNPQAQIFSDAGFTPIVQPIITDGFGHYDFYALPGLYTVVILFGGKVQQFYIDQSLGNIGTNLGSSLQLLTNGSPNFNQGILNLIQGPGMIISNDNLGNTTFTATGGGGGGPVLETNGVANTDQALLNLKNGTDIGITSDGAGGVTVSSTARGSLPQPDAARFSLWEIHGGTTSTANPWDVAFDSISSSTGGGGGVLAMSYIAPTTAHGPVAQLSCGFLVGAAYTGAQVFLPANTIVFKSVFQTWADPLDAGCACVFQMGLSDVTANVSNALTIGDAAVIAFTKPTQGGPFGNIHFVCSRAGVTTDIDTGLPASDITGEAGIRYEVEIRVSSLAAELFINGSLITSINTHLPLNPLGPALLVVNAPGPQTPNGTLLTNLEYMYAESPTP